MNGSAELPDWLPAKLTDSETAWSVGGFGAIAEFMRDEGEAVSLQCASDTMSAVTARGGLRITAHKEMRPVASESLTTQSWSHRVSLCLPDEICAMDRRVVLTETGPDREALRVEDDSSLLFDLGLGLFQVNACIRTGDAEVIAALRTWTGRSLFDFGNAAMGVILSANPHRVFESRLGRIEVYQPIPPPGGKSPEGPHTHVLPRLLRHKRTHAATEFVPPRFEPCAHLYPPHPARDARGQRTAFSQNRHATFQDLLARFGEPRFLDLKRRVFEGVSAAQAPFAPLDDRFSRAAVRIALRQIKMSGEITPSIDAWITEHDRFDPAEIEEAHPCTA
jgi:hypothetical protein